MNTWQVWFNNPRQDKGLYEALLIEAPTERMALKILLEKFKSIKTNLADTVNVETFVLEKDKLSFSVDKDDWGDLCLIMKIHGHKHCVARVRPYFVPRKLDFAEEIKFSAAWAWHKECVCGKDDFEMYEYSKDHS